MSDSNFTEKDKKSLLMSSWMMDWRSVGIPLLLESLSTLCSLKRLYQRLDFKVQSLYIIMYILVIVLWLSQKFCKERGYDYDLSVSKMGQTCLTLNKKKISYDGIS